VTRIEPQNISTTQNTPRAARPGITVILPCYNESENIAACLESVAWADEIMVVDSFSTDNTVKIASRYTQQVLQHEYVSPAAQRNWAIPQAHHEWVLIIDADERITPALRDEIKRIISSTASLDGYAIRRRNYFAGKEVRHCGWQHDWIMRLFRRDKGVYEPRSPYDYHAGIKINGSTGRCREVMDHFPYKNINSYLEKLRRYADWGGLDADYRGKRASFGRLLLHPIGRFLRMYILHGGILDGMQGLVICTMAACYVALQDVRLWEIQKDRSVEGS
jgi:glycosyltransferase involved in cell wall biosynthesis